MPMPIVININPIIIFFILQVRQPVDCFKQAYGLYGDTWAPLVQSALNLAISFYGIIHYGILGVLFGTIVSYILIVMIWRPYYLFKYGFNESSKKYLIGFLNHLMFLGMALGLFLIPYEYFDFKIDSNIISFVLGLIISISIFSTIYFLILKYCSRGFQNVIKRFKGYLKKVRNP